MKRVATSLMTLALLAAPAALLAQGGPQGRGMGMAVMALRDGRTPVDRLLERRADLALTDEQAAVLQEIGLRLTEQNTPHRDKALAILGDAPAEPARMRQMSMDERQAMRAKMEEARPHLRIIQENNRKALEEVREALSEEQREKMRELLRPARDGRRGPPQGRRPPSR